MAKKKRSYEAHVRLYRHELESLAYRSLSCEARALLVEFRSLFNGVDNNVYMSHREARKRLGGVGQAKAQRALDELTERGFIRVLTKGAFNRKTRHATEYMLTNEAMNNGQKAPKDFMSWRPTELKKQG